MSEPMELRGVDLVVIPAYQPSALLLDLVKDVTAAGYGAVVRLQAAPAQTAAGMPETRYVAVRGFAAPGEDSGGRKSPP